MKETIVEAFGKKHKLVMIDRIFGDFSCMKCSVFDKEKSRCEAGDQDNFACFGTVNNVAGTLVYKEIENV